MPTNILPPSEVPAIPARIATSRVKDCFRIAEKKTKIKFRFDGVQFFSQSTDAGYVIATENNVVYLNLELFQRNTKTFLDTIIPHEVAHIVARAINPKETYHGKTWKSVMQDVFSLPPERCHTMNTNGLGRNVKHFVYICACTKHTIGSIRHKKILKGKKYVCKSCKKQLVFLKEIKQ